jgi:hypothetical protein
MDYQIVTQKVTNAFVRNLPKAVEELTRQVNERLKSGWEPIGGIQIGSAGSAPYLMQALVKRR